MEVRPISIESYYDSTVIWKRHDATKDSWGKLDNSTANWDEVDTVDCLLRPLGGAEQYVKGKETVTRTHIIYCKVVSITEADRAFIGSEVYRITGIKNPNSLGHHMEVDVEQIV